MQADKTIERIAQMSKEAFAAKRVQLSFEEYLELLLLRPYTLTRNVHQVLRDMFEHYGAYEVDGLGGKQRRFMLFDDPGGDGAAQVFGQEPVQNRIYEVISGFAERGRCDRFVLLHGPNGASKSSLVDCIRSGLEAYSRDEACPLFRFSWVFCERGDKGELGFGGKLSAAEDSSLANMDDRLISSRLPCEMKDPPWLLIPKKRRVEIINEALEAATEEDRARYVPSELLLKGELSPKNKVLYEALLRSYKGDWRQVLRHVRVERYYISHRYRTGAVTIEPQTTVDAGTRMLTHASMEGLPAVLSHEEMHEAHGDLVDANHGVAEYSDFLKRALEANKYLLTTVERGFVNLPSMTVALDLLFVGTSDEKYLAAFKRDPSFPSFKGRMEFVRVPYLRRWSDEAQIYERHLASVARSSHVAPHASMVTALFAVLTRLRRPDVAAYEGVLAKVVRKLAPIEKARFYEDGTLPDNLDEQEQQLLRESAEVIATEWDGAEDEFEECVEAAYEGRCGASPREMLNLLSEVAVEKHGECILPMDLLEALPRLLSDPTLYAFLRVPANGAYGQSEAFITTAREELIRALSRELRSASQLVDEREADRLFADWIREIKAFGTGESVADPRTREARQPDRRLMEDVERLMGVSSGAEEFRSNIIRRIAAFRLGNPEAPLVLRELFQVQFRALERSFYRERESKVLQLVRDSMQVLMGTGQELDKERREAATAFGTRLITEHSWCERCVGTMLAWYLRHHEEASD
ncbi:MAG: hypothetical protein EXS14_04415 [Planctomycetes bacterium]|nr:hypothetical protein [Planctomycetota bacterium]